MTQPAPPPLADRKRASAPPEPTGARRRLLLRLTTTCNSGCAHCPLVDLRHEHAGLRTEASARDALAEGRRAGCRELALLRGEATLLPWLPRLVRYARGLGYTLVQLQTNGRRLADPRYAAALARAGLSHCEISLYGPTATLHDAIARAPGAFAQTTAGLAHAMHHGLSVLVHVHVLAANVHALAELVALAQRLGAPRVQLDLMRPVPAALGGAPALSASPSAVRDALPAALAAAAALGVTLTTEAMPDCLFADPATRPPDAWHQLRADDAMRVDDLHRIHTDLSALRAAYRADPPPCHTCGRAASCPRTWASWVDHHGDHALRPLPAPPSPASLQRVRRAPPTPPTRADVNHRASKDKK